MSGKIVLAALVCLAVGATAQFSDDGSVPDPTTLANPLFGQLVKEQFTFKNMNFEFKLGAKYSDLFGSVSGSSRDQKVADFKDNFVRLIAGYLEVQTGFGSISVDTSVITMQPFQSPIQEIGGLEDERVTIHLAIAMPEGRGVVDYYRPFDTAKEYLKGYKSEQTERIGVEPYPWARFWGISLEDCPNAQTITQNGMLCNFVVSPIPVYRVKPQESVPPFNQGGPVTLPGFSPESSPVLTPIDGTIFDSPPPPSPPPPSPSPPPPSPPPPYGGYGY